MGEVKNEMLVKQKQSQADAEVNLWYMNQIFIFRNTNNIKSNLGHKTQHLSTPLLLNVFFQAYMATSRAQYNQQLLTDQYIKLQMAK